MTYLLVRHEDHLAHVIVHCCHGLRALVQHEVDFTLDLLTIRDLPDKLLNNLRHTRVMAEFTEYITASIKKSIDVTLGPYL